MTLKPQVTLNLSVAAVSDVGRVRRDNQDSGFAGPHLLVVADGVGGAVRGDVASSAVVDELRRLERATDSGNATAPVPGENEIPGALEALAGAIHRAHNRIAELVDQHPELDGTSTTVSAGLFDGTQLAIAHVGDSRAYLLREGSLRPLTTDHTLVQNLVDEGRITEEEARVHPHRNLILKAVDGVHEPEPDLSSIELQPGDRLLFCSDGCSGVLTDDKLALLLAGSDLQESAGQLVTAALDAGSSDNVTVVLAEVLTSDEVSAPVTPLVVGAAVTGPHNRLALEHTGTLDGIEATAEEDDVLDEELRYAPRPPRRFAWLRRAVVLFVTLGLIIGGGNWLYSLSQDRYYVSSDGSQVAIYQGVQADLPVVQMHHVYEGTTIRLAELPSARQRQVRDGITAENLADARRIVSNLRGFAACEQAAKQPKASPTLRPRRTPSANVTKNPATAAPSPANPSPTSSSTPSTLAPPDASNCDEAP